MTAKQYKQISQTKRVEYLTESTNKILIYLQQVEKRLAELEKPWYVTLKDKFYRKLWKVK